MASLYLCQECDRYQPKVHGYTCFFCGSDRVHRESSPDDHDGEGDEPGDPEA